MIGQQIQGKTFYNVAQHKYFNKDGGRVIYFEGTYTNTFTSHVPTPRYNYNQVMYKLDLANPKLGLAPVQGTSDNEVRLMDND
ncbi:hypothetical protein [Paenibacillus sp. FSL H7-0756]|jgi:hypothetical protein|uniref:hypothetical protein n=1 Tax=Paenibacillus sp. FSL H7-0756 TaxID=2954738 RepID=UPI0030F4F64C